MTDTTSNAAGSAVDETTEFAVNKAAQYLDKIDELVREHGGDAADLGLTVLRVEAAGNILYGIAGILLLWAVYAVWRGVVDRRSGYNYDEDECDELREALSRGYHERSSAQDALVERILGRLSTRVSKGTPVPPRTVVDGEIEYTDKTILVTLCVAIAGIVPVIMASGLIDVWNWVGLFWPEAYAVHKFILS